MKTLFVLSTTPSSLFLHFLQLLLMEALFQGSSYLLPSKPPKTITMLASNPLRFNFHHFPNHHLSSSSSSFSRQFSLQNNPRKSSSLIMNARRKDKKEDTHSSVPKSDEATGFFPESVLLKKVVFLHVLFI